MVKIKIELKADGIIKMTKKIMLSIKLIFAYIFNKVLLKITKK